MHAGDPFPRRKARQRASALLSAMIVATGIGIGLVSYLNLARNSMRLSQRTYFMACATNLAEAGLEEAIRSFRLADAGTALSTAFSGWTLSGSNAKLTLPSFACGSSAIGVVKVFVAGYDGTLSVPAAYVQATITPTDGSAPVTKTLKVTMKKKGAYNAAIATTSSLSMTSGDTVDSFNSNPAGATSRLDYPGNGAGTKGNVVAYSGSITLAGSALVNGSVFLGSGVSSPAQANVNGTIVSNFTGQYPTPALPSWPSGGGYYGLLSFPSTLPRTGDTPAADGRYYYYPMFILNPLTLGSTTISDNKNVTIYCTSVSSGLTLGDNATCIIWTGNVATTGTTSWTNPNWAGALQIYSWGSSVSLGAASPTIACIYAPLATVSLSGGGANPTFVGAIVGNRFSSPGGWDIHYDESLANLSTPIGTGWSMTKWYDLDSAGDSTNLTSLTSGFLN